MSKTRVAVIGVGHHGRHHARIYAQAEDVELVAVVDARADVAEAAAREHKTRALPDPKELVDQVDAVSIVVPTTAHARTAAPFLRRGVPTLIEKPLALHPSEAREMVRIAHRSRTVLQVGHIERYNPAWTAVDAMQPRPMLVDARRLSKYPFRSLDVSVVFDVMIHDLELVMALVESPVESVEAVGSAVLSPTTDVAEAWVQFANRTRATFWASRVHHEPVRQMRLWDPRGEIEVDFFARQTTVCRPTPPGATRPDSSEPPRFEDVFSVKKEEHDRKVEPLRLEIEDFLRCAREGARPKVDGERGYAAVALAAEIEERVEASQRELRRKSA